MLSWGGNSTFDGDSYIQPLFGQGAFSCNDMPEIDEIVQQGRATADQAERVALYQKAGAIVHEEAPWIFLHLQPNTYGVKLTNDWEGRPDEMIPLGYLNQV
jgi:peptide/nickel transport system substrate-binding protein